MSNEDICKCGKTSCVARKSCLRFDPAPERGQAMYAIDPTANEHGSCDYFKARTTPMSRHTHYPIRHRMDSINKAECTVL